MGSDIGRRCVNATDARKQLFEIIDRVNKESIPVTITINGSPRAIIMGKEDYDAWITTIETIYDKQLMATIKQGDRDIRSGRYTEWSRVRKELGINLADVQNNSGKQGKKGSKKAG